MQKNKILMEEFINGPQMSTEAIVCNKSYIYVAYPIVIMMDEFNYPYIVEDRGETPANILIY